MPRLRRVEGCRLNEARDAASFVFVRSIFGVVIAWHALHYLMSGRVARLYIDPPLHFHYLFFEWVEPLPGIGLHLAHFLLGLAGLALAIGWRARIAAAVIAVLWAYFFLLEQARYLNHAYLIGLLALLFAWIPVRDRTLPTWGLWLLRFQLAIPYVYGGIAKFEPDWLAARPARMWLAERSHMLLVGWMGDAAYAPYLFAWGGLAFDLLAVPLLLWRRTRVAAFAFVLFFHLANAQLFDIGVFPWLMIPATTLFFDPSWPRRFALRPRKLHVTSGRLQPISRWCAIALVSYVLLQALLPFRHLLYPGRTSWTEEGHSFAWRMMLRSKDGEALFHVYDPHSGTLDVIDPSAILPSWQEEKMAARPDLVHQFARWLAAQRGPGVQVRVSTRCSLNGRPAQALIEDQVDLAAEPRRLLAADWIVPLQADL